MPFKCSNCGVNIVSEEDGICGVCKSEESKDNTMSLPKINLDKGNRKFSSKKKRKILINNPPKDIYGDNDNVYEGTNEEEVKKLKKKKKEKKVEKPLASGITKNITIDIQRKSKITKWFKSVFAGIPYTSNNRITMFQVYPNSSKPMTNQIGNTCDQIIVYGRVSTGAINQNNSVEIFGIRDELNNIIATKIINKSSGTTILPDKTLSPIYTRLITIGLIILLFKIL